MRITLIHALRHSITPVEEAFQALWPQPDRMNILDDSLSNDLARDGQLTPAMTDRFLALASYAVAQGASGILFTCSAFGPCIDAVKQRYPSMPVLKPNEAMIDEAVKLGKNIGLLSTFPPTLVSMPPEFPKSITLVPKLIEGGMAALNRGDGAEHDRLAEAAAVSMKDCDVVALAQFSLARAAGVVAKASGRPVLTTTESAVNRLKAMLG